MTDIKRAPLAGGFVLGEYEIKKVLGAGGFGITYLAADHKLSTEVAIKEYFPIRIAERAGDLQVRAISTKAQPGFNKGLEGFLNEARTLAKFKHPNIVSVLRFVEAHGTAYLVMEYAQGQSLQQRLLATPGLGLPESEIRAILDPIIDGLAQLHAQGIIHRDIKPDNIFVREDGTPMLIDFGGARDYETTDGQDLSYLASPFYSPLEQLASDTQGPWSDIYGLGGVAYAMVSWNNPVSSTERANGEPMANARSAAKGQYSKELLSAIDAALELDADKRPRSLLEWRSMFDAEVSMHQDLEALCVRAYPQIMRLVAALASDLGLNVSFEEASVFSLACCVIELRQRTSAEMTSQDAWRICGPLAFANEAVTTLSGGTGDQSLIEEGKEIEETFSSRFEQYSASYTLDAENDAESFALTGARLGRNLFPLLREIDTAKALPPAVHAGITQTLKQASSVVDSVMDEAR